MADEIVFGPNTNPDDVTEYSRAVLREIMKNAHLARIVISSTRRLPADQARVMYQNLEAKGVAAQRKLYLAPGQQVIDAYVAAKAAGKTPDEIKAAMTATILAVGPQNVSKHASDPHVLNVFDIAPSSVANGSAFEAAVNGEKRVAKFLKPPNDPGYHLEIPQPKQG